MRWPLFALDRSANQEIQDPRCSKRNPPPVLIENADFAYVSLPDSWESWRFQLHLSYHSPIPSQRPTEQRIKKINLGDIPPKKQSTWKTHKTQNSQKKKWENQMLILGTHTGLDGASCFSSIFTISPLKTASSTRSKAASEKVTWWRIPKFPPRETAGDTP